MDNNIRELEIAAKAFSWFYVATASVLAAMGMILIIWPENAISYICYLLGGGILVFGIFQIVVFVISRDNSLAFQLASGILITFMGIFIVGWPEIMNPFMEVIVSVIMVLFAIFAALRSALMKKLKFKEWAVWLFFAIMCGIIGTAAIFAKDALGEHISYYMGAVLLYEFFENILNMIRLQVVGTRGLKKVPQEG